jgi:hypothetical protein
LAATVRSSSGGPASSAKRMGRGSCWMLANRNTRSRRCGRPNAREFTTRYAQRYPSDSSSLTITSRARPRPSWSMKGTFSSSSHGTGWRRRRRNTSPISLIANPGFRESSRLGSGPGRGNRR